MNRLKLLLCVITMGALILSFSACSIPGLPGMNTQNPASQNPAGQNSGNPGQGTRVREMRETTEWLPPLPQILRKNRISE